MGVCSVEWEEKGRGVGGGKLDDKTKEGFNSTFVDPPLQTLALGGVLPPPGSPAAPC